MEKYDYRQALINDIKQYIQDNPYQLADPFITDNLEEYWYDILWAEDCITGNGGDWYDTEEKCAEYICHNMDLIYEAAEEYGIDDMKTLRKYYESQSLARYFDCTIRCYLLGECLQQALEN